MPGSAMGSRDARGYLRRTILQRMGMSRESRWICAVALVDASLGGTRVCGVTQNSRIASRRLSKCFFVPPLLSRGLCGVLLHIRVGLLQ